MSSEMNLKGETCGVRRKKKKKGWEARPGATGVRMVLLLNYWGHNWDFALADLRTAGYSPRPWWDTGMARRTCAVVISERGKGYCWNIVEVAAGAVQIMFFFSFSVESKC